MKFSGFPRRVRSLPAPAPLFGELLERIDDLAELKCLLRVIWLLQQKRGYPRFVTLAEAQADRTLAKSLPREPDAVANALDACARRGTLAVAVRGSGADEERLYALNTETDRLALARAASDVVVMGYSRSEPDPDAREAGADRPNIYALYEANIGMLSPMIADELKEAEALYPAEWIEQAFREAASANVRHWRYIARILDRWEREGRTDGKPVGHTKKATRY